MNIYNFIWFKGGAVDWWGKIFISKNGAMPSGYPYGEKK